MDESQQEERARKEKQNIGAFIQSGVNMTKSDYSKDYSKLPIMKED
jgi:hypothetical protein